MYSKLEQRVLGLTEDNLVLFPGTKIFVHAQVLAALQELTSEALKQGFRLKIISGFRGFDRQLTLFNEKAKGTRTILDAKGEKVSLEGLSKPKLLEAILRWSALPGTSRHHWGTDFDVVDAHAIPDGYQVQLIDKEVDEDGMFGPMHEWLDENLTEFGFFRPYDIDRGGVYPERWHISYYPKANVFQKAHSPGLLKKLLETSSIELKDEVLANLDTLFKKYFLGIADP